MNLDLRKIYFGLGIFLLVAGALFLPRISHNDGARWSVVWSVVEDGGYDITNSPFYSFDHLVRKIDGHHKVHSRKPAFISHLAAPIYYVLSIFGIELTENHQALAVFLILSLLNFIPFMVFVWCYLSFLMEENFSRFTRTYCLVLASLGTYMTGYLWTLNNHLIAAIFLGFCLFSMYRSYKKNVSNDGLMLGAVFFLALAICAEVACVIFALGFFSLLVFQANYKLAAKSLIILVVVGVLYLLTEYQATGLWLPYQIRFMIVADIPGYVKELDPFVKMPALLEGKTGLLAYLFHITLGHHGFFSLTPSFLLATNSKFNLNFKKCFSDFSLYIPLIAILSTILLFLFYASRLRNFGGLCQGFRWAIWLTPLWLFSLPYSLDKWLAKFPRTRTLALVFLGISMFSALSALPSPWQASWLDQLLNRP